MLPLYLLVLLIYSGDSIQIPLAHSSHSQKLIDCVVDIIREYFAEEKEITYVGNKVNDEELLKSINEANIVSVATKQGAAKLAIQHRGFFISESNASSFTRHFADETKQSTWNPTGRFLLLVRNLKESELRNIFDIFLKLHVNNVLVVNATDDAHLYTYNPFDNYNCGKRYDNVISMGKCSQAHTLNLYPAKLVTELKYCTFNVLITHWPPYTILTTNESSSTPPALRNGVEPYLVRLMGEMLGFNINIKNDYDETDEFATISPDMQAVGVLKKIQDNKVDMQMSGMLLTPSRAAAFSIVYGHLVYIDEIRFVVKRARNVHQWKYSYLEFDSTVWVLLILALLIYTIFVTLILRTEDKSYVVLILLDNLFLHGRSVQSRWTVKCVLILWVVFAYLVNTFYTSSLFSLTTQPAREYQISKEEEITKYQLKPCLSSIMGKYYVESVQSSIEFDGSDVCHRLMGSVEMVANSENLYTLLLYGIYQYNEQDFIDKFGNALVMPLSKPYSKVIYSMYLYKGFPLLDKLSHKSIQLRENGLVQKALRDMNYLKKIKYRFHQSEFIGHLAIPWFVYFVGCTVSIITFVIEVRLKRK